MWGKNRIWKRKNIINVRIECGERKTCGKIIWKKSRKQKKKNWKRKMWKKIWKKIIFEKMS